jgi:hypothetical protein
MQVQIEGVKVSEDGIAATVSAQFTQEYTPRARGKSRGV